MSRPLISIPTVMVDGETGEKLPGDNKMWMLPAAPGKCETCATEHEAHLPHNAQSLFYQTRFNIENGRSATWLDAMAHCDEAMRQLWTEALTEKGVDVAGGQVNPSKGRRA